MKQINKEDMSKFINIKIPSQLDETIRMRLEQGKLSCTYTKNKTSKVVLAGFIKCAASFLIIICILGTTAYATGLLDNLIAHYEIGIQRITWSNHEGIGGIENSNIDKGNIEQISYDEVINYSSLKEASIENKLKLAFADDTLEFQKITVSTKNHENGMKTTHLYADSDLDQGKIEVSVDKTQMSTEHAKEGMEIGVTSVQNGDSTDLYTSDKGAKFTLLNCVMDGDNWTIASIMINESKHSSYIYTSTFIDVPEENIYHILDKFDFGVYLDN